MSVTLSIRWDSQVPGLSENEVSLIHFGPALNELLNALQATASAIVSAAEDPDYGVRGGRRRKVAKQLDLRLQALEPGSAVLRMSVESGQSNETPMGFASNLPERTARQFVAAVRDESQGRPRSGVVRRYLRALPGGISQQYRLQRGGEVLDEVQVLDPQLVDAPAEMPSISDYIGRVVGVGFEPGQSRIKVRYSGGTLVADASRSQVEAALTMREQEVRIRVMERGKSSRCLLIRPAAQAVVCDRSKAIDRIFRDRKGLLRRLAN